MKLNRRKILSSILLGCTGNLPLAGAKDVSPTKPNIVVILV